MIHPTAVIGEPPEHRDWNPSMPIHMPEIDPTASVNALVTVDAGMSDHTRVGARTLLMKKVHIGHDAQIGADVEIAPLTSVGGHVVIGDRVKVGQGATLKPWVKVGDGARIGMGAVVIRDVPAGVTVVGNPAKILASAIHWITEPPMTESELEGWEQIAAHAR
jgi:acyl-[acyl carrier protein]--UDP-N-acetylglucosamine O-acyltransferase